MYDRYEWEAKGRTQMVLNGYRKPPFSRVESKAYIGGVSRVITDEGFTKWMSHGIGLLHTKHTYHARKRDAMKASVIKFIVGFIMRPTIKMPDLTNAVWSEERILDNRFDVLRVTVNGEMHQVATVYESASPQFWTAIRGKGQVPLEGATTFEEARAVAVALLRMGD